MYFPSFLQECFNAIEFINVVAENLLKKYMFHNLKDKNELAENAAKKLADFSNYLSHGRSLNIDYAINELKLEILDIRNDKKLDKLINQIYISIVETFNRNPIMVKIFENNKGHGTIRHIKM